MDKNTRCFFHCYSDYVHDYGKRMCDLVDLAHKYETVYIELAPEGTDINEVPYKGTKVIKILEDLCQKNNWPKTKFIIVHSNPLQKESTWPALSYSGDMVMFLSLTSNNFKSEKSIQHHFGSYVMNSSWPRLWLSSYLYCNHRNITDQTFVRNLNNPAHAVNIDLDNMLFNFSSIGKINDINLQQVCKFLDALPIVKNSDYDLLDHTDPHWSTGSTSFNNEILSWYNKIFIDIVYETFYSGETFYPTEKMARPLFTKTPFIVFGPANFLKNLRKLGFKTFNKFWSEEYDDFSGARRVLAIKKVIDNLSKLNLNQLNELYNSMTDILENNYRVYKDSTLDSFIDRLKK